jgi:hypothetical protein
MAMATAMAMAMAMATATSRRFLSTSSYPHGSSTVVGESSFEQLEPGAVLSDSPSGQLEPEARSHFFRV